MNTETFTSLQELMKNLNCKAKNTPTAVLALRYQCEEILEHIEHLGFTNNSAHVQLATKQALQYIHRALEQADAFTLGKGSRTGNQKKNLMDICGPAHASLEIILNLNYN
ncbi:hypothetical protein [Nibribacter koreensis]